MTGILVSAGIWGRPSDRQPHQDELPEDRDVVVIAHLKTDLFRWSDRFIKDGYAIWVIVMVRDPWVQMRSRAKAAGSSQAEAQSRYQQDYKAAMDLIVQEDHEVVLVSYECLLWKGAAGRILSLWGLTQQKPLMVQGKITEIRDENGKWYAGL